MVFERPNFSDLLNNLEIDAEGALLEASESDDEFFSDNEESDADSGVASVSQSPFNQMKKDMTLIGIDVWKKIVFEASPDAEQIDLSHHCVEYRYSLYQEGVVESFDSNMRRHRPAFINIYQNHRQATLQGITEAISSMKEGEKALFVIGYEKMFKELGCPPRVAERADILAEIHVCSVTEIGEDDKIHLLSSNTDQFDKLHKTFADALLRAGNSFKEGSFKAAIGLYKKVLAKALFAKTCNADEKQKREDIINKTYLNVAICYNRLEDYRESLTNLEMVEQLNKSAAQNLKFLFTKAKALMMLGEFADAEKIITAGMKLEPGNPSMLHLQKELKERVGVNDAKLKAFAKKFVLG